MTSYAGLDVAEQATHVCVVDEAGKVVFRGVCRTEPAALHELLAKRAPQLGRAVLETGALASWLSHGLAALGVPVVCVCARQAHAALQHGPCKTDRGDAEGLARLAQTGWLKQVHVRSLASHEAKSLVIARERLVHIRQDLVNLIRGLLKPFGILTGRLGSSRFDARVRELAADRPMLLAALDPLLTIRLRILDEIRLLDEQLPGLAKDDEICRRLMTIVASGNDPVPFTVPATVLPLVHAACSMARHGEPVREMALRMTMSLRMAAVSASFLGLPALTSRW